MKDLKEYITEGIFDQDYDNLDEDIVLDFLEKNLYDDSKTITYNYDKLSLQSKNRNSYNINDIRKNPKKYFTITSKGLDFHCGLALFRYCPPIPFKIHKVDESFEVYGVDESNMNIKNYPNEVGQFTFSITAGSFPKVKDYTCTITGNSSEPDHTDVCFTGTGGCPIFQNVVFNYAGNKHHLTSRDIENWNKFHIYYPDTISSPSVYFKRLPGMSKQGIFFNNFDILYYMDGPLLPTLKNDLNVQYQKNKDFKMIIKDSVMNKSIIINDGTKFTKTTSK